MDVKTSIRERLKLSDCFLSLTDRRWKCSVSKGVRARSALLIKPLVSVFLIKTLYINVFNLQSYMISVQKQSQNAERPLYQNRLED